MRTFLRAAGVLLAAALLLLAAGGTAGATGTPGVDPASTSATLLPGQSIVIPKVVHTSTIPPKPDLIFLSDTTGSMGSAIANVKANVLSVMNTVLSSQPQSEFGVAHYKDFLCDAVPYNLDQPLTASTAAVQTAVNTWSAGGGCDTPESQLNALYQLATDPAVGFRTGSSRIIAWFGDAPGHDPSNGISEATATSALVAAHIRVIAISTGFDQLDQFGQASRIAAATGGSLLHTGDDVAGSILAGLNNLPVTIAPSATCDPGLTASYDHPDQTVTSGDDASFVETVTAASNIVGGTYACSVKFLSNGLEQGAEFTETVNVTVPSPDLSLTKTGPAAVQAGDLVTYTLTGTNNGPSGASGVAISDPLPANSTFVSADPGCALAAGVVTCTIGSLANGASSVFHITVRAGTGAGLSNTATIAGDQVDPHPANNTATASSSVNRPPVCSAVAASVPVLWPPNHLLVTETLSGASDADGNPLTYAISSIRQDEALNALGDGTTTPDAKLLGGPDFQVRAERSGTGDGRVYYVSGSVSDGQGGSCSFSNVTVAVPHDQAHAAVGGGPLYNSL